MMRCWRIRLDWQAWSHGWAAAVLGTAKGVPLLPGPRGTKAGFQAGVAANRGWHRRRQRGTGIPEPILPAAGGPHDVQRRLLSGSAGDEDGREEPEEKADGDALPPLDSARMMGSRRKRAWERSLSPLERVSRMVPEEFRSPEVRALGSTEGLESQEQGEPEACGTGDGSFPSYPRFLSQTDTHQLGQASGSEELPTAIPSSKNFPFQVGDLILAEIWRKHNMKFKKLAKLASSGMMQSPWGVVKFVDIIGKFPGQMLETSTGALMLIRRPSLEEFVLNMKRGPAITSPKVRVPES